MAARSPRNGSTAPRCLRCGDAGYVEVPSEYYDRVEASTGVQAGLTMVPCSCNIDLYEMWTDGHYAVDHHCEGCAARKATPIRKRGERRPARAERDPIDSRPVQYRDDDDEAF